MIGGAGARRVLSGTADSDARSTREASASGGTARAFVLSVLGPPEVLAHLRLSPNANSRERLMALARAPNPVAVLRSAGCSRPAAEKAVRLLPEALEPSGKVAGLLKRSRPRCSRRQLCVVCIWTCAAVLFITALWLFLASTVGWRIGTCSLGQFTNQTCSSAECSFVVNISEETCADSSCRTEHFTAPRWRPQLEWDYWKGQTAWEGAAFRCCNREDCCSFYDQESERFCDDWAHRSDFSGKPCSTGKWLCAFQLGTGRAGREVARLRAYSRPPVVPLLGLGLALSLAGACVLSRSLGCDGARCWRRTTWSDKVEELAPIEQEPVAKAKCPRDCEAPACIPTPVMIPGLEGGYLKVSWRKNREYLATLPRESHLATPPASKRVECDAQARDSPADSTDTTATDSSPSLPESSRSGSAASTLSGSSVEHMSAPPPLEHPREPPAYPVASSSRIPGRGPVPPPGPRFLDLDEVPMADQLLLQSGRLRTYATRPTGGGLLPSILEPKRAAAFPRPGVTGCGYAVPPERHPQAWTLS
mmetsp:Transcript_14125/g.40163  ORF Transcript_14125/g.40163 Transcript_14125/m.40163 type:complete len:534 (+) Transcript_14125:47-1648(+)